MATLTLRRIGKFTVQTTGPNPCGIKNPQEIEYEAEFKCGTALDSRGFLFEQLDVDKYFQNIKSTSMSCEKLVMRAVKDLRVLIHAQHPACKIKGIKLTLRAAPGFASMTYDWKAATDDLA